MNIHKITIAYIIVLIGLIFMVNRGDYAVVVYLGQFVQTIPYGDKLGHFLLMGLLSFTVNLSFKSSTLKVLHVSILKGSLIIFIVVTLEEFSQIFVSNRTFDMGDLFFDYLGIFLFGRLAWYFSHHRQIRQ